MRIVCISDTHGGHRRLEVPEGDVAIFAGDVLERGDLEALRDFDAFLGGLPHSEILVVAGNHDLCFEDSPGAAREALTNALYLQDESTELRGVRVYGSPWQPRLVASETSPFAFDRRRGAALAEKWEAIPENVDLLVTHSPPKGVRDEIYTGEAIGCRALRERLEAVDPALHVFGHVHEHPGASRSDSRIYVNASCPGGYGSAAVVDWEEKSGPRLVDSGEWLPDWLRQRMERKAENHRD